MRLRLVAAVLATVAVTAFTIGHVVRGASAPRPGVDWPQFRGIRAAGIADGVRLPVTWNIGEGKGVAWRTAIPGLGHSSPVVWGDQIFITTSISGQKDA